MRYSLPALSRAVRHLKGDRSKEVHRLTAAARRDAGHSWSRKTAAVLEVCVRNEPAAASTWDAVRLFAQLPPQRSDVQSLLPVLQQQAMRTPAAVLVVGDMAQAQGLLASLNRDFVDQYVLTIAQKNPFKAVELWKALPTHLKGTYTGVQLYLAANQMGKAEQLVSETQAVAPTVIRKFIEKYAKSNDVPGIQKWVDRWQAATPVDINWLHHIAGVYALRGLRLPKPLDSSTCFPLRRAVGKRVQHLVSALNALLANSPELFETPAVRDAWYQTIDDPSMLTLEALALEIARAGGPRCDWTPVLKLVSFDAGVTICELAQQPLSPSAYAAVLSRAGSQADIAHVLHLISAVPETLYTSECLSALAQRSPAMLLELALPQDMLEVTLSKHHLMALWKAGPSENVIAWLLPLTLKNIESAGLFRCAGNALLAQGKRSEVRDLLYEFIVNRRFKLDDQVVKDLLCTRHGKPQKPKKLPKPQSSGLNMEEAMLEFNNVVSKLEI